MAWRIGVDSGGTFTDVCLFEESTGHIAVWKVSSTPADPSRAVADGASQALAQVRCAGKRCLLLRPWDDGSDQRADPASRCGDRVDHQRRVSRPLGNRPTKRPDLYDLQADKPPTLVERRLRREVPERPRHDGHVETTLDKAAVRDAVRVLRDAGVEAVAICFLYSFLDPAHEEAARRIVAEEFPQAFVCASHEVAPEFREYERRLLLADLRADFAATRLMALPSPVISEVEAIVADLRRRCAVWFADAGIETNDRRVALSVDMRYAGQNYELSVPLPAGPVAHATIAGLPPASPPRTSGCNGFVAEDEPMQLVTFRAEATGIVPKAEIRPAADMGPDPSAAEFGRREIWLYETDAFVSCPLYDRERLSAGNHIEGPAVVEEMDATTLIVPGAVATVDPYFNLLLEPP